jgi:hypothetical protein
MYLFTSVFFLFLASFGPVFPEILRILYFFVLAYCNLHCFSGKFAANDLLVYYYCIINGHKGKSGESHMICCCIENEDPNNGVHRESTIYI